MRYYFYQFRVTKIRNRYGNCRYWHGSRLHAALNAVFRPWHANLNLLDRLFMSWKQGLDNALIRWLADRDIRAIRINAYYDDHGTPPGCDCCSAPFVTEIYWVDTDGAQHIYEYDGSFADLIGELPEV